MNRAQSLGADATAAGTKMFNGNGKRLAKVQLWLFTSEKFCEIVD